MSNKMAGVFLAIMILMALPFLLLFMYTWPSSDDYGMGLIIGEGGQIWEPFLHLYHNWGGRYSTWLFALLSSFIVSNLCLYRLILILVFLLLFLGIYYFMSSVLNKNNWKLLPISISMLFLLLFINIIPGIADSFYWYSGMVVYNIPLALIFFLMGSLINKPKNIISKAFVFLSAFFIIGFNEIGAFLMLLLGIARFAYKGHFHLKKFELSFLLIIALGLLLLFLSPGNFKRMELFPEAKDLATGFRVGLFSFVKLNVIHVKNISLWLLGLLIFSHLKPEIFKHTLHQFIKLHPLIVIIAGQTVFFICMLIPAFSMGINPPLRVYNFLSPLWILWFFWVLASLHYFLSQFKAKPFIVFKGIEFKAIVLIIIISFAGNFVKKPGGEIVFGGNIPLAWHDIMFKAKTYNRSMHEREEIIFKNKKHDILEFEVPSIKHPPKTILFTDITSDPDHWINELYANHYGLKRISTTPDTTP